MGRFIFIKQLYQNESAIACLQMICRYYGKVLSAKFFKEKISYSQIHCFHDIFDLLHNIGLRQKVITFNFKEFRNLQTKKPCIIKWRNNSFALIIKATKKKIILAEPSFGKISYTVDNFLEKYYNHTCENEIAILTIEPTPSFFNIKKEKKEDIQFKHFYYYLLPYKGYLIQLFFGTLLGSVFGLIFPFLTKSLVDYGISNQDIDFIYLILIANLVLLFSQTCIGFIKSWIMLHMSTRISVSLVSDFFHKLLKLPISFFESKPIGDIMQRIGDLSRIQGFLMNSTLGFSSSVFNFIIFTIILLSYNSKIFFIFITGSILSTGWIILFLKKRKTLDYEKFEISSENQSNVIQILEGAQEIKLTNYKDKKMLEWEDIQARLFKNGQNILRYSQTQTTGNTFINGSINIFISVFTAKAVVSGEMTLGMMMAIQSIMGQLKQPIGYFINAVNNIQDSKISFERLAEIYNSKEEQEELNLQTDTLPSDKSITFNNVYFKYKNTDKTAIEDINIKIPAEKVTAIVGMSGSGKSTIIKLMLGFYTPDSGVVKIGNNDISKININCLRENCGVVTQNSFIFNDTVLENIVLGKPLNEDKLYYATKKANIHEFIENLPNGYFTQIGTSGNGLSQGQRQRILIARAIYKNPHYLLFDEATNALDSINENEISQNMEEIYKGKTVILVAHRLSTIMNADNIIVLNKGKVVEQGTHYQLLKKNGDYFKLFRNQINKQETSLIIN